MINGVPSSDNLVSLSIINSKSKEPTLQRNMMITQSLLSDENDRLQLKMKLATSEKEKPQITNTIKNNSIFK